MKTFENIKLYYLAALSLFLVFLWTGLGVAQIIADEIQVTNSSDNESRPTLGQDDLSSIVVYTSRAFIPGSGFGAGKIIFQRLDDTGLLGTPTVISIFPFNTDDKLNDISGDYIVYTAFESLGGSVGQVKVYNISNRATITISAPNIIQEARIHGDKVVWIEGSATDTNLYLFDLDDYGLPGSGPIHIAGPASGGDPATAVDIGDELIVWEETPPASRPEDEHRDIYYYDLSTGDRYHVVRDPSLDESEPSTSGPWVTWSEFQAGMQGKRIRYQNVRTFDQVTVATADFNSRAPTIDGDLIAYEGLTPDGDYEIFLYRISTDETFQLTEDDVDQRLNNLFGDIVAYVDSRNGNNDIFVNFFTFEPPNTPPIVEAGDDLFILVNESVTLNGSANDPDGDPIDPLSWLWNVVITSGTGDVIISDPYIPTPDFTATGVGGYTLSVQACDDRGACGEDTVTIHVGNNQFPEAVATSDITNGPAPLTVNFDGSQSSDPENRPLTYRWIFGDASADSFEESPTHSYDIPGVYVVVLSVFDDLGQKDETTITITVTKSTSENPPEMIIDLIDEVQDYMDDGLLTGFQGNRLIALLNRALNSLNNGYTRLTEFRLNRFINIVSRYIDRGELSEAEGQALIDAASAIIEAI